MKMIILYFIMQVMLMVRVFGDMFTSVAKLEPLIATEDQLLVNVQEYLHHEKERIDSLERLVQDIQQERVSPSSGEAVSIDLGHPIQSYLLLRRLRRHWVWVTSHVNHTRHQEDYLEKFQQLHNSSSQYPSEEDLKGSIRALLRLQDTYALPTSSMANGSISGERTCPPLHPGDCIEIAEAARSIKDVNREIEWMQEASTRELQSEDKNTRNVIYILNELAKALHQQGNISGALENINQILELDPENPRALKYKSHYEKQLYEGGLDDDIVTKDEQERYKALCRGDHAAQKKPKHPGKLLCRYNHNNNPRLFIRPAREEIIFDEPRVIYYHDIITDKEIELLKQRALPEMQRAMVGFEGPQYSDDRIGMTAWINISDSNDPLGNILPRVQDYTGLSTKENHAEHMQVVNYGLGGFYLYHYDDVTEGVSDGVVGMGKRTATVLFYLSDVEAGGATVFTKVGIRVPPVKGSAVLWYNYLKNGDRDMNTRHAGCPVLMGTKWASNLWIDEFGQVFKRKCGLTPEDKY